MSGCVSADNSEARRCNFYGTAYNEAALLATEWVQAPSLMDRYHPKGSG